MEYKKIMLIIDQYYNKPIKNILDKMFLCEVYCLSNVEYDYNKELNYYFNQRTNTYKNGLDNGCNIVLNFNDDDIINLLKIKKYNFIDYKVSNNVINNYKIVKEINEKINFFKYIVYNYYIFLTIFLINRFQKIIRKNIGFEINKGSYERIENSFINNFN